MQRTGKNEYSTKPELLDKFSTTHKLVQCLLETREFMNAASHFLGVRKYELDIRFEKNVPKNSMNFSEWIFFEKT